MYTRRLSDFRAHARAFRHVDQDAGDAFVPDFRHGFVPVKDGDAEACGEEFIAAATSAEGVGEAARDELYGDDVGGLTIEAALDDMAGELDFIARRMN